MKLLTLNYNQNSGHYSYSFSENAPANCKDYDYHNFSEVNLKDRFILFIGSIWYGIDVRIASDIGDIACNYPNVKFYFKIILDESELERVVPKEVKFTHLPIILYVEDMKLETVSTGPINKESLEKKIKEFL